MSVESLTQCDITFRFIASSLKVLLKGIIDSIEFPSALFKKYLLQHFLKNSVSEKCSFMVDEIKTSNLNYFSKYLTRECGVLRKTSSPKCASTKPDHIVFLLKVKFDTNPVRLNMVPDSREYPGALRLNRDQIILMGSSTGGVDALLRIISDFRADCPPTLIVQHTGGQYLPGLIRLLDGATEASVRAASDGDRLERGIIYFAPDDSVHLELRNRTEVALSPGPRISGHRPSVDALFLSAVGAAKYVSAAILTGMGRDGARGITELRQAGARTIGQNAATSVVYGMSRVAKEMGGIQKELPLDAIGQSILAISAAKASQ